MPSTSGEQLAQLSTLRKLATEARWVEVREALDSPATQSHIAETAALFEEIGDQHAAAGDWGGAVHCYNFGLESAKRPPAGRAGRQDTLASLGVLQLRAKGSKALMQITEEDEAFAAALAKEIVGLAKLGRAQQAETLFGWLRGPKHYAVVGPHFELAANHLVDRERDIAVWLYRKADQYYHAAHMTNSEQRVHNRLNEILYPRPEPAELKQARKDQAKFDAVVPKLEALARARKSGACMLELDWTYKDVYPRISAHFEVLGDQVLAAGDPEIARHMYVIAANTADADRIGPLRETLQRMRCAEIDHMIAHPVTHEPVPEPLTFDNGLPYLERLILAGRWPEGDAVLARMQKLDEDYCGRFIGMCNSFQSIGDYVASTHRQSARWFYQKAYDEFRAFANSADTLIERDNRQYSASQIKAKLDSLG